MQALSLVGSLTRCLQREHLATRIDWEQESRDSASLSAHGRHHQSLPHPE